MTDAKSLHRGNGFSLPSWRRLLVADTVLSDTTLNRPYQKSRRPTYRPKDRQGDPFSENQPGSPLLLGPPANVKLEVEYDDSLRRYDISERIGELEYRNPTQMSFEEYSR